MITTLPDDRYVLLASIDSKLPPRLIDAMRQLPIAPEIRVAFTVRQLSTLLECHLPQVVVMDEILLDGSSDTAKNLTAAAPVILLARPERFGNAARILIHDVECIAQTGDYVSLLVALIERHVRWARQPAAGPTIAWAEMPPEFAELRRHEINNPLTGIGNAEMVLAHRERLPAAAAKRLELVVDLAVRLRETIRRRSVTRTFTCPKRLLRVEQDNSPNKHRRVIRACL